MKNRLLTLCAIFMILTLQAGTSQAQKFEKRVQMPGLSSFTAVKAKVDNVSKRLYVLVKAKKIGYYPMLLSFDLNGMLKWVRVYSLSGAVMYPVDLTFDAKGYIYVLLSHERLGKKSDIMVMKLDKKGKVSKKDKNTWAKIVDGVNGQDDNPMGIGVDKKNNVYIAGSTLSTSQGNDFLAVKMNKKGRKVWAKTYDGPNHGDAANAVAINSKGDIVVAGYTDGFIDSHSGDYVGDYQAVMWDKNGTQLWANHFRPSGDHSSSSIIRSVDMDDAGRVVVSGVSPAIPDSTDSTAYTISYSRFGSTQWFNYIDYGPIRHYLYTAGDFVCLDGGNTTIAGRLLYSVPGADIYTIGYDSQGAVQYLEAIGSDIEDDDDIPVDLKCCGGAAWVVGNSASPGKAEDILIGHSQGSGTLRDRYKYEGASYGTDFAQVLAVDKSCNAYVVGMSPRAAGSTENDLLVLKY